MKRILLVTALVLWPLLPDTLICQTVLPAEYDTLIVPADVEVEDVQEELIEQNQSESDVSSLMDHLQSLQENPYDLNLITAAELEGIPGVTSVEAGKVLELRKLLRKFTAVAQLNIIEEIGPEIHRKVNGYVFVPAIEEDSKDVHHRPAFSFRTRTVRDLQPREGFTDGSYRGSSFKSYSRVLVNSSDAWQAGALFEKDAGERFRDGFASGYVSSTAVPGFASVIVGDFTVESGQGLVFWSSSAFGKGSNVIGTIRKTGVGARPYKSSDEFNFFRGAVATSALRTGVGQLEFTFLYSLRRFAGSVNDDETVSSLAGDGLFRTDSEIRKKGKVGERLMGATIHLVEDGRWKFGGSYSHATYDRSFETDNVFGFTGKRADVFGLDGQLILGGLSLFGEAGQSNGGARAIVAGGILHLSRKVHVACVYRDYPPAFYNLHASGFGEHDGTSNERGYYVGVEAAVTRWLKLRGYIDQWDSRWRTSTIPLPSTGRDVLFQAEALVTPRVELSGRYSRKTVTSTEQAFDNAARELRWQVDRTQQRTRLNASYRITTSLRLKGRLEATSISYSQIGRKEAGYLIYQDLRYQSEASFFLQFRVIFFHTDSYDSRVYEYESDLRGVFSNPALYGKGRRYYVVAGYRLGNSMVISAKYGETQKDGVTVLSSGSSTIRSDIDNRLSVQIDVGL